MSKITNRLQLIMMDIAAQNEAPELVERIKEELISHLQIHPNSLNRILRNDSGLSIERAHQCLDVLNRYGAYQLQELYSKRKEIRIKNTVRP